jgi:hypothetical protein
MAYQASTSSQLPLHSSEPAMLLGCACLHSCYNIHNVSHSCTQVINQDLYTLTPRPLLFSSLSSQSLMFLPWLGHARYGKPCPRKKKLHRTQLCGQEFTGSSTEYIACAQAAYTRDTGHSSSANAAIPTCSICSCLHPGHNLAEDSFLHAVVSQVLRTGRQ